MATEEESSAVAAAAAATIAEELELRKANDDVYSTKQQDKAASGPDGIDQYELAKTQVTKVAKSAISDDHGVQLRKEVVLGLIKASTVFISYLSAAALEKTQEAGNKTISAQHVLAAFKEMDFPEQYYAQLKRDYNEKVKAELEKARANGEKMPETDGTIDQVADPTTDPSPPVAATHAGEESLAVGEETLAAVDSRDAEEQDEEAEEEDES